MLRIFQSLYNWLFVVNVQVQRKMLFIDCVGGSGKTTLSKSPLLHNHYRISVDDCKYGEGWKRYSATEFEKRLVSGFQHDTWVYDGTYYDEKLPLQMQILDSKMKDAVTVFLDLPLIVVIWRKLFRSLKRWLGIVPVGSGGVESWSNIKLMIIKVWNVYHHRRRILKLVEKRKNVITVPWPKYVHLVE